MNKQKRVLGIKLLCSLQTASERFSSIDRIKQERFVARSQLDRLVGRGIQLAVTRRKKVVLQINICVCDWGLHFQQF
jgi:hypothetical protein